MTDEVMAEEYLEKLRKEKIPFDIYEVNNQLKRAFLAGLKASRPEWHKVADGDLPEHEVNVLVLHNVQCIDIAHYNYDYKEWHFTDSIVRNVIAWCEIPKYTGE